MTCTGIPIPPPHGFNNPSIFYIHLPLLTQILIPDSSKPYLIYILLITTTSRSLDFLPPVFPSPNPCNRQHPPPYSTHGWPQKPKKMSSYLASLTTHYTSLRRLLPTSLSEETDLHISSPSDSHVSRVLRAYYTEKQRPFPAWLGPDPNASTSSLKTPTISSFSSSNPNGLNATSSLRGQRGGATGLGDLFADSPQQGPNAAGIDPLSLRQRRPGLRSPGFKSGSSDSIPYPQKVAQAPPNSSQLNVRPLPSQRVGSYQRLGTPPSSSASSSTSTFQTPQIPARESSVQERLKARLGGRSASPVQGSNYDSAQDSPSSSNYNNPNPYASNTAPNPSNRPYTGSSSPWSSGEQDSISTPQSYTGAGYSSRTGNGSGVRAPPLGQGRVGLPSGPRPR